MTPEAESLCRKLSVRFEMSREEVLESIFLDYCASQVAAQRVYGKHPTLAPFIFRGDAPVIGQELYEVRLLVHEKRLERERFRNIMESRKLGKPVSDEDKKWIEDNSPFDELVTEVADYR